jgi:hypothetical protein
MVFWIWIAVSIWAVGMVAFIIRLWYFYLMVLGNLAPGVSPWSRAARYDPSSLTPTGQIFRQKLIRLQLIAAAYGFGGLLLIGGVANLIAKHVS